MVQPAGECIGVEERLQPPPPNVLIARHPGDDRVSAMMRPMSPPLVVEVHRGPYCESRHEVDVSVVGLDGHRSGHGTPGRGVLARSAMKPIQALSLVESGAADAFGLGVDELALACASHSAEPDHLVVVDRWLATLGLDSSALECGAHLPIHADSAYALVRDGGSFDARHNNCSGKHCGFLTVCRHLDIDFEGYLGPEHRLQRDHITPVVEELCEVSVEGQTPAVDGCGIPVWEIPLDRLAAGWAGLGTRPAGRRLFEAMTSSPRLVAGSGRMCTRLMTAAHGRVVAKTGAEGVYAAAIPEAGIGLAVKARDGAGRAAEAALLWVLADLGWPVDVDIDPISNWAGTNVGELRVLG